MVSTRSSTIPASTADNSPLSDVPADQSITLQPPPAREEQLLNQQLNIEQQPDINLAALLLQQTQLLQQMERRLANLEGQSMQAPEALAPPVQAPAPPATPVQVPAALQFEDPCKCIKLEISKFDGKDAEAWIINFERYCKIIKLRTDEDILLAMGIAMTGKATLWWHHIEQEVTTWQEAKEAVTCVYGDPRKKKDCANRLKNLSQGSMTISEFFVEVQNLNTYAQLDVETHPTFLEPGLNDDLRRAMEYMESLQPIDTR